METSGPKLLTSKVLSSAHILPCYMDGAFPFDEPYNLRNCVLRRYGDQHVRVIWHHMTFQYLALASPSQFVENFAQVFAKITVQLLFAVLRYPC